MNGQSYWTALSTQYVAIRSLLFIMEIATMNAILFNEALLNVNYNVGYWKCY